MFLPASGGHQHPLACEPFVASLRPLASIVTSLLELNLPHKDTCDCITFRAHLEKPGKSLHLRTINLITSINSLYHERKHSVSRDEDLDIFGSHYSAHHPVHPTTNPVCTPLDTSAHQNPPHSTGKLGNSAPGKWPSEYHTIIRNGRNFIKKKEKLFRERVAI